ncbi:DUF350 domain-containing protein [Nocardia thailandica]|uniref:DUF350 domain-containing protein n=1 Tax=Nocardia thailandica TaxID=257275 RepID=A0ABW6PS84_9NOCA|nr:DUF350 domain-containing protein [Nocardia thailandica]
MTALALESGFWSALGEGVGAIILYCLIGLVLMLIGFFAIDLTTPGKLRDLVIAGKPNAIIASAAGMISMAFIVVFSVMATGGVGKLSQGLIAASIYGLVGIIAQVISVRVIEKVTGIDIGRVLHADTYSPQVLVVAAAHFALGLVVAFAIL